MAKKDDDSKIVVIDENDFGKIFYIVNDPKQKEFLLTGITVRPGSLIYTLSYLGEEIEAYPIECSAQRNEMKYMEAKYMPGADDDDE